MNTDCVCLLCVCLLCVWRVFCHSRLRLLGGSFVKTEGLSRMVGGFASRLFALFVCFASRLFALRLLGGSFANAWRVFREDVSRM